MNSPILELKNISLYINQAVILKKISWTFNEGENWAIIGRNGSGKSFLLKLLMGEIFPSEGTITVMGNLYGHVNLRELRKKIGFISDQFQRNYDATSKVKYVILSGYFASNGLYDDPEPEMIQKALEIMDYLEISHLSERYYGTLSQGEQKRVLIGRALVHDPDLLIFDEPCGGLDYASREKFLDLVSRLTDRRHHILFVTHHIEEIVKPVSHILLLKEGSIYNSGKKEDVFQNHIIDAALEYRLEFREKNGRYWPVY